MIRVAKIVNELGETAGFRCEGHAGYAESGNDIVCAAVSALVFTTMNSIEALTEDTFSCKQGDGGLVEFVLVSEVSRESALLLASLFLGLQGIQKEYGKQYLTVRA